MACAGNDWEKAGGRGRERLLVVPYMREVATPQRPLIVFLKQVIFILYLPIAV